MNFEQSLKRLDEIVSKLENNEISLEESIDIYKEGIEVLGSCRRQLEQAELVVKVNDSDN